MKNALKALACIAFMGLASPANAAEALEGNDLGPKPDFEYIDVRPLIVPIITDKGVTQQVSIVIQLEVPYGGVEPVKALMPKLSDAYITDLYSAFGSGHGLKKGAVVNVPVIKQRLAKNTQRVLGPDKVTDVLIQVVQQSPR